MQKIASLLFSVLSVYVALLVPTTLPFFFHWNTGVLPPLVGVAVNVTLVPGHIVPVGEAAILTLTGWLGLIVTVMPVLVAGLPVAHGVILDVSTHVIISPLARLVLL
jgi:hypothetical protein